MEYRQNQNPVSTSDKAITGYAMVWYNGKPETEYRYAHNAVERFTRANVAVAQDVISTFNHTTANILGRTKSGTLQLEMDDVGLKYRIEPSETQLYRDTVELIKRGDIAGSSVGFVPVSVSYTREGNTEVRYFKATIHELGPVVTPAYSGAEVSVRNFNASILDRIAKRLRIIEIGAYED